MSQEPNQELSPTTSTEPQPPTLRATRELIAQAPSRLRPGGMLALEIGIGQGEALLSTLAEKNYRDIYLKTDYSGVTRFLFARYG